MINLYRALLSLVLNKYIYIIFSIIVLQGCVAVQSFPTVARAGDTIILALGSSDNINISDTVVTYTPDNNPNGTIDISENIRSIFKLYPDKRSTTWLASYPVYVPLASGHGASLDVMVIDLPSPQVLSAGTGVIRIQNNAVYPLSFDSPVGKDIAVTILEGSGSPSTFDYLESGSLKSGNLQDLEAIPHIQIKPDYDISLISPLLQFAAAEITITGELNSAAVSATPAELNDALRVIPDDSSNTAINQKQVSWKINSGVITINFISPNGKLAYFDTSASILFLNPEFNFSAITGVDVRYFDVNGVETTGPSVGISICANSIGCLN